jgi:hypothetical protein
MPISPRCAPINLQKFEKEFSEQEDLLYVSRIFNECAKANILFT